MCRTIDSQMLGHDPRDDRRAIHVDTPDGFPLASSAEDVASWLHGLSREARLTPKGTAVIDVMLTHPQLASYAPARVVAALSAVNEATVTRVAQALGFQGWQALRQELRARYLSMLSAPQVAAEHHDEGGDRFRASLRRDVDSLAMVLRQHKSGVATEIVAAIAQARHTLVVASGSYLSVGLAMAHNASVAGYPTSLLSDPEAIANAVARLTEQDTVVIVSFWRMYRSSVLAAEQARAHGSVVCAITDSALSDLARQAHHTLIVPTEGISFMPSLTASMAVVQALVAQLAGIDPQRTAAAMDAAERAWSAFGLTHRALPAMARVGK